MMLSPVWNLPAIAMMSPMHRIQPAFAHPAQGAVVSSVKHPPSTKRVTAQPVSTRLSRAAAHAKILRHSQKATHSNSRRSRQSSAGGAYHPKAVPAPHSAAKSNDLAKRVKTALHNAVAKLTPFGPTPFVMKAPVFDTSRFQDKTRISELTSMFDSGKATHVTPQDLVRAGIVSYDPLNGGIYKRRRKVSYIILHSTETGRPATAQQVIHSWGNNGLRHAGAQFVVDRDGTIYMSVVPDLATVHVETTRALYGVNNDNSVGIEIDRTGKQVYTPQQMRSVERLVLYLQERYHVADCSVLAHKTVQPSDRRDPVNFNWTEFWQDKIALAHAGATATNALPMQLATADQSLCKIANDPSATDPDITNAADEEKAGDTSAAAPTADTSDISTATAKNDDAVLPRLISSISHFIEWMLSGIQV